MNVLITCAGRRNYLVEYFKTALDHSGLVFAADASAHAPALYSADRSLLTPSVHEPDHLEALLDVCRRNEIELLVSVNDLELPRLAASSSLFAEAGTHVLVSDPSAVEICADKLKTGDFLEAHGFDYPRTAATAAAAQQLLETGGLLFPLVVKPRFGSASLAVEIVGNESELAAALALADSRVRRSPLSQMAIPDSESAILVQEFVPGDEYGLDVLNDLDGRYVATAVKKKLLMRAGETDRAVTVRDGRLEDLGASLGRAVRHVGVLDCDVIVYGERLAVIDMNPRFGGGYPFSHAAGVDMPAAVLSWLRGEEPDPGWFRCRPGVASAKYDVLMPVSDVRPEPTRRS